MFRIFFLLVALAITGTAGAQKQKTSKAKLTENSIVKDTAGNVLPAGIWQQLAMSSSYTIYPANPAEEATHFVLRHLTEAEKDAELDKLPRPRDSKFFRTGSKLAHFDDKDINGNIYNLKDLKGKVVVINFWFINCPPCRMEIPELNALVEKYKGNSEVVFLGIAMDDKYRLQQFLQAMPFNYNIIAEGAYLARKYNVTAFPTHVVVDKEGAVTFHTAGLAKNTVHWVKMSIEAALAQPAASSVVARH